MKISNLPRQTDEKICSMKQSIKEKKSSIKQSMKENKNAVNAISSFKQIITNRKVKIYVINAK